MRRIEICSFVVLALLATSCKEKIWDFPEVYPEEKHEDGGGSTEVKDPFRVESKANATSTAWNWYSANTIETINGFTPSEDPERDEYGGWKVNVGNADGFFRVRKIGDRWWMVDPAGNVFLSQAVAVFAPGGSDRQKQNMKDLYGSSSAWAKHEITLLKDNGFNSLGAWSEVNTVKGLAEPMPYTVIVSPMGNYNGYLKSSGTEAAAFKGAKSWEGYPYDFAMVFDPAFDSYVEKAISAVSVYQNDKYCIGYFIDNEIPWKDYALESCFKWPSTHINHQTAQAWLDQRKGKSGATLADATAADKKAFIAYCFETYMQKVTTCLKRYDPNHLFLGCRFNQWDYELSNEEIFKVAGKYMDVISVNHYKKWQPDLSILTKWESWSGKPCLISEFYTKGVDSGMANTSGAGWLVRTQNDRGLFYQNFVNELVKSKVCVGWHWFTYMDNDPENPNTDDSNKDSNKGIVKWNYDRYDSLLEHMKAFNNCTYNLARFYAN